jgi:hypothetical protein
MGKWTIQAISEAVYERRGHEFNMQIQGANVPHFDRKMQNSAYRTSSSISLSPKIGVEFSLFAFYSNRRALSRVIAL